jgi:hypothetical protein
MSKIQTKRRHVAVSQGTSPRFEIVRDGEPLPEIALRQLKKPRIRRARPTQTTAAAERPHCPLCDGEITRFDMEVYEQHDRCAPCHEALS